MEKFSINYSELESDLSKPKHFKYEDVKDRLIRVAYDVVKFQDASEDIDGLWQIQATDDGEVIVAMYETPSEDNKETLKSESSWAVIQNRENIDVFYKGDPIYRIASSSVSVTPEEIPAFCDNVANKLNTNDEFKQSLLSDLPETERTSLFSKYPELTNGTI